MNLELHRKMQKLKEKRTKEYIISKINSSDSNNNMESITGEEIASIIESIRLDYLEEREKIINRILEQNYNIKKFKIIKNKEKYINKQKNIVLLLIENMKNYFSNKYEINNDYCLGYCKSYAFLYARSYEKTKYCKILGYVLIRLAVLEGDYSEKLKVLYRLSNNYEELQRIRKYESINRNYILEQYEQQSNIIKEMSKNIKKLKYNCDKTIDKGFFGL